MDKNIQFAYEFEENRSLPFLGTSLIREGDSLKRTVYKKEMNSQYITPNSACSPFSYKFSTFSFIINRSFKVCSEAFFKNELDNIHNIAGSNGYRISSMNKLINYYRNVSTK